MDRCDRSRSPHRPPSEPKKSQHEQFKEAFGECASALAKVEDFCGGRYNVWIWNMRDKLNLLGDVFQLRIDEQCNVVDGESAV
jgi:hypothetical protein